LDIPGITSTTDKSDIPTHPSVGAGHAGDQQEQGIRLGDIYLITATSPVAAATARSSSMSLGRARTTSKETLCQAPWVIDTPAAPRNTYRRLLQTASTHTNTKPLALLSSL